ncbi:MAG: M28 family peptidase [Flavobacteriales bacterium]|nr:M28 family peptidase [Flavobacteriales bacterium]
MTRSLLLFTALLPALSSAQFTNINCTDAEALQAMKGQHDPADYAASLVIDDPEEIICALRTAVNGDSIRAHLERIVSFGTRHTYSDTLSETTGIGAARRWAMSKLQQWSTLNEDRLLPSYIRFDYANEPLNCGSGQDWRNVIAVLPGSSTVNHRVIIIEAHLDSRCADNCDPDCDAQGAEDNGSGSALVLELARVMSRYTFPHTLVFMLTTGEEHGLLGARAMAQFCQQQSIAIKGVLNNDIVGGILCGETASPPGCGIVNEVDSLQLRIFSHAASRGLARMIRLSYDEKLSGAVPVPMLISVLDREDRVGRGSDHIPFRQAGWPAVRFTAANEHGDGDPGQEGYDDRQHTSEDILGLDLDGNGTLDTLFVDFNYLARNTVTNGASATLLAHGPEMPSFNLLDEPTGLRAQITGSPEHVAFRVGVRGTQSSGDLEAVYRTTETSYLVPNLQSPGVYYVSVAGIDAQGITSIFSAEQVRANDAATPQAPVDDLPYGLGCMPIGISESSDALNVIVAMPNPFIARAELRIDRSVSSTAELLIHDGRGRLVLRQAIGAGDAGRSITLRTDLVAGLYRCTLMDGGRAIAAVKLVALN